MKVSKEQKALYESALQKIEEAEADMRSLHESLQETFDNRSEKWQESERGEEFQEFTDSVEEKADDVSNVLEELRFLLG